MAVGGERGGYGLGGDVVVFTFAVLLVSVLLLWFPVFPSAETFTGLVSFAAFAFLLAEV